MRLTGEIEALKKQEAERLRQAERVITKARADAKKLEDENEMSSLLHEKHVQVITQALAATDLLLREHEIPINPNELPSIHAHSIPRIASRSKITRYIFEALSHTEKPSLTTTEVAVYVATKLEILDVNGGAFPVFKYQIRKRLGHLVWEGRLDRLHLPKTSVEGRWKLLANS